MNEIGNTVVASCEKYQRGYVLEQGCASGRLCCEMLETHHYVSSAVRVAASCIQARSRVVTYLYNRLYNPFGAAVLVWPYLQTECL
jgi:hypothetical protein